MQRSLRSSVCYGLYKEPDRMPKGRTVPAPKPRDPATPIQTQMQLHPAIPGLAQELADDILETGSTLPNVIAVADRAATLATNLVEQFATAEHVACRAGCSWCCTFTSIRTSAPEVLRIAAYLRTTLPPDDLRSITKRLAQRATRISTLPEDRRGRARIPCALLVNQRCSIYPVRPLACMGVTSSNAAACEASYRSGWTRPIPNGARHLGIAVDVRTGMTESITHAGLDGSGLDLNIALLIALETPDAADRWLAGEPVFADATL